MRPASVQSGQTGGRGYICARPFGLRSSKVEALACTYPVRLISPSSPPGASAVLVFVLNHGGGLVAGDEIEVHAEILSNARLGLLTQGSTKIYRSLPNVRCTTQSLKVTIRDNASLVVLQDPVQPFRGSVYRQEQIFEIDPLSSSLLLLDWVSEGRSARNERWDLTEWRARNEVWSLPTKTNGEEQKGGRLLLRDNTMLFAKSPLLTQSLRERMEQLGVFGTVIIRGPLFENLGNHFLQHYACQPRAGDRDWSQNSDAIGCQNEGRATFPQPTKDQPTWTATSVRNFVVVRFGATSVEHARHWLRDLLTSDGTVEKEFGKQYLLCLQDR